MVLQYLPSGEIIIDNVILVFGDDSKLVRNKLRLEFKQDDKTIPLGEGLTPISRRRDVYSNADDFFFLNYDDQDKLKEIEVHNFSEIKIFDITFDFESDVDAVANKLKQHSIDYEEKEGEYIFFDLKIVIINAEKMGGEGSALGYIYFTTDMTHLRD